jgi:hypothetical protein
MTNLERFLLEAVTYAVDVKEFTLFCRLCSATSTHPENVKNRYCGNCHTAHNVALERWLAEEKGRS